MGKLILKILFSFKQIGHENFGKIAIDIGFDEIYAVLSATELQLVDVCRYFFGVKTPHFIGI